MNKSEYFEISNKRSLTLRCPILDICQRRALTIYYFSFLNEESASITNWEEQLKHNDLLSDDYLKNKVEVQGESVTIIKGENNWYFNNVCPEICLFEGEHTPINITRSASISGDWDKFRRDEPYRVIEERHFSECPEFAKYSHKLNAIKDSKSTRKPRTKIPQENKVRAELQREIKSECPFCLATEVGHFEIHHIDENPSNHEMVNLLLLCRTCHSKITKGDISQLEVYKVKMRILSNSPLTTIPKTTSDHFNNVNTAITGNYNNVVIKQQKPLKRQYPPDCIGYESLKANYVGHLIKRYNEYKAYELDNKINYAVFAGHLKKHFKIPPTRTIYNLPIGRFDELVQHIQYRIDKTKLAKIKGKSQKNYSSFSEYQLENG